VELNAGYWLEELSKGKSILELETQSGWLEEVHLELRPAE